MSKFNGTKVQINEEKKSVVLPLLKAELLAFNMPPEFVTTRVGHLPAPPMPRATLLPQDGIHLASVRFLLATMTEVTGTSVTTPTSGVLQVGRQHTAAHSTTVPQVCTVPTKLRTAAIPSVVCVINII